MKEPIARLFGSRLCVINMGVEGFARTLEERSVPVVQMDWRPPAGGDARLLALLDRVRGRRKGGVRGR